MPEEARINPLDDARAMDGGKTAQLAGPQRQFRAPKHQCFNTGQDKGRDVGRPARIFRLKVEGIDVGTAIDRFRKAGHLAHKGDAKIIVAGTPGQGIRARTAIEQVVAIAAQKGVVAVIAAEGIIAGSGIDRVASQGAKDHVVATLGVDELTVGHAGQGKLVRQ